MEATFAEAGLFEPAVDVGLYQGVRKLFNTLNKDGSDLYDVPVDLGLTVAVAEKCQHYAAGIQVADDFVGCLQLGEVIYFLARDLFGYAFIIVTVGINVKVERHCQKEGNAEGALVGCDRIEGGEWCPA